MKKIFIPAILFAALAAVSSCSEDLPNDQSATTTTDQVDLVAINVSSGTTRGTDVTTNTLEDSESGVKLHIVDSGTDDSATSGAFDFKATDSDWSQSSTTTITWGDIDFPAHFSSMHDGTSQTLTASLASSTLDYLVTGESSSHNDLVYHSSQLDAIPTGGTINVFHKHALAKIHLYAATSTNKVYIARVNFVNVDGDGTATITPVSATEIATTNGLTWTVGDSSAETYEYLAVATDKEVAAAPFQSSASTSDPIINSDNSAPFMIIPQTTLATTSEQIVAGGENITGSYFEVIYYMTDSDDQPIVGFSSVAARSDYANYIDEDQSKVLYVMGAFPVGYTFVQNKEYDITLGLGSDGSTGGILLVDYYVDKDGNEVSLTDVDGTTTSPVDIPEIDTGDDILAGSDDQIDIMVSAYDWEDGEDPATLEQEDDEDE